MLTNEKGEFRFVLNGIPKQVAITITAIGAKKTLTIKHPASKTQTIYLDLTANMLDEFAIKGLSAEDVVRMAVSSISVNYADTSYFDYSFYRRYQKLNGRYVNLMEAYPDVMFRLTKLKQRIVSKEAFAVKQLRRTKYYPDVSNVNEDNPADLLEVNPVYHLQGSSLYPGRFVHYSFSFDTANKSTEEYRIKYICGVSSTDQHGVPGYDWRNLRGETWERGELVIERRTFAIKKFHRISHRHEDYDYLHYPLPNNSASFEFHQYGFNFLGGDLLAEYKKQNGKWYLKKMVRQYSNEFYNPVFGTTEFTITDNFEWYSGDIARYTTTEYADKFFIKMPTAIYSYDTSFWEQAGPPFHYDDKATIYKQLQRDGPLLKQFNDESKLDELKRKPTARKK